MCVFCPLDLVSVLHEPDFILQMFSLFTPMSRQQVQICMFTRLANITQRGESTSAHAQLSILKHIHCFQWEQNNSFLHLIVKCFLFYSLNLNCLYLKDARALPLAQVERQWKIACCGIYFPSLMLQAFRIFMHGVLFLWGSIQICDFKPHSAKFWHSVKHKFVIVL